MKKFLFIFIFLFFSAVCLAQPFEAPKVEKDKPLEIRAEQVDIYRKQSEIYFINKVKATQGEMEILSDKMVVQYNEDKNAKISVEKIIVEGEAKLFTKNITATGNEGVYDFRNGIVSLKGDVVANEKGAIAYGDEFTYNVNTRKTTLLGNKKKDDRVIIILEDIQELEEQIKQNKQNDKR